MDYSIFLCLVLIPTIPATYDDHRNKINRIIKLIQRRYHQWDNSPILVPRYPEDLPEAEPIHPGHTLLRPAMGMLKSAVKFPHRDTGNAAVYGNYDNLGITYGKTDSRIKYTDFRKSNSYLNTIFQAVDNINRNRANQKRLPLVVIESGQHSNYGPLKQILSKEALINSEDENNANEVVDNLDDQSSDDRYRRRTQKIDNRYRDRTKEYENKKANCTSSSSGSSESSDYERNTGNPYTVHKNKYKQNWLWNHFMDGDHMNINPYGPQFNQLGPTGGQLFLGRKWWYFNQDDYKPFR